MTDPDKIYHVYPKNDSREHIRVSEFPAIGEIYCGCPCEPDWKKEGESAIVVHNSFDGREGLEWAKELLNPTTNG